MPEKKRRSNSIFSNKKIDVEISTKIDNVKERMFGFININASDAKL